MHIDAYVCLLAHMPYAYLRAYVRVNRCTSTCKHGNLVICVRKLPFNVNELYLNLRTYVRARAHVYVYMYVRIRTSMSKCK